MHFLPTNLFLRYCQFSDNACNYSLDYFIALMGDFLLTKSLFANSFVSDLIMLCALKNGSSILVIGLLNHSYYQKHKGPVTFGRIALARIGPPYIAVYTNILSGGEIISPAENYRLT